MKKNNFLTITFIAVPVILITIAFLQGGIREGSIIAGQYIGHTISFALVISGLYFSWKLKNAKLSYSRILAIGTLIGAPIALLLEYDAFINFGRLLVVIAIIGLLTNLVKYLIRKVQGVNHYKIR